uniref:Uncharacterized protein n=1 Tax=Tetranychus urticae TaxID=32264 RepID=A0A158P4R8_TETUR
MGLRFYLCFSHVDDQPIFGYHNLIIKDLALICKINLCLTKAMSKHCLCDLCLYKGSSSGFIKNHFIEIGRQPLVNTEIKNHCLEDLVLKFVSISFKILKLRFLQCFIFLLLILQTCFYPDWSAIRPILSKYPNLKHLGIHGRRIGIIDENIPELLKLLPLSVFSKSNRKVDSIHIDWYCRQHSRSISFFYQRRPKVTKKWPHLSTKHICIGRGFDFMKYCFLKDHENLPYLLDPNE